MGKNKKKHKSGDSTTTSTSQASRATPSILAELRADKDLWYKILVLVYDLKNLRNDKSCERRTLQTTDPLYISEPYFTPEEANIIRTAIVATDDTGAATTMEASISSNLENFFEKRRASADCRPCGPHDMVPVYLSCFGIEKAEIEDQKFVSRVRRNGTKTG